MKRKLFAGTAIRALREKRSISQVELARRIHTSPGYLSQIEANQRPLSAALVIELARVLRVDVSEFSDLESDRLVAALKEIVNDDLFKGNEISVRELKDAALNAPHLSHALVTVHSEYRRLEEKYRSLDDALLANEGGDGATGSMTPFEKVRDFFHFIGNYIDPLDRAAEELAKGLPNDIGRLDRLRKILRDRFKVELLFESGLSRGEQFVSGLNETERKLVLNDELPDSTKIFAIARYIALLGYRDLIQDVIDRAAFRNSDAEAICKATVTNYFAGALTLPYGAFLEAARETRHDVERLAARFGASMEQVCHRLSTLQRPSSEGIPFYFLRVDRAGNITKRHSATRFQFARYGGACPIWNIHEAFEAPDRFLVQVAEMPDGIRYLSLAHAITKGGGKFGAARRRYAIGFGCELSHAREIVYSDAIDVRKPSPLVKIGVSCRLCERPDCPQRAMPPIGRVLSVNPHQWSVVPYTIRD